MQACTGPIDTLVAQADADASTRLRELFAHAFHTHTGGTPVEYRAGRGTQVLKKSAQTDGF